MLRKETIGAIIFCTALIIVEIILVGLHHFHFIGIFTFAICAFLVLYPITPIAAFLIIYFEVKKVRPNLGFWEFLHISCDLDTKYGTGIFGPGIFD